MKDLPGLAWIVGGFVLSAVFLFLYARSSPGTLPRAESAWAQVEDVRGRLQTRKIELRAGESREETVQPYRLQLKRLKNLEGSQLTARYILSIHPLSSQLLKGSWLGEGMDVAFLDLAPSEVFGLIRLVSFRKVEIHD